MDEYIKHMKWAKLRVGIVITIGLAVIFLTIMFAGHIEDIFTPQATIYAIFYDVRGLRAGAPIWFSGIEIGHVKSMSFYKGREIRVKLALERNVIKHLKKDSTATILTLGLLGDKYLELSPGSSESPGLSEGDNLVGMAQLEFQDIVEKSKESISRLNDLAKRLDHFIAMVEEGKGTLPMLLKDRALYDNLTDASRSLSIVVRKVDKGNGTLGRLLSDDKLYANLESSAGSIKAFSDRLNESDSTLNKLIKDKELYDRFLSASSSLDEFAKKLTSGQGTMGKLVEDKSIYENLDAASKKFSALLERIEEGKGVLGDLTTDGELDAELKTTVKDLNGLLKDIKENPKKYFKFSLF